MNSARIEKSADKLLKIMKKKYKKESAYILTENDKRQYGFIFLEDLPEGNQSENLQLHVRQSN